MHQHPRRAHLKPLSTDSQPSTVPVACVDNDQDVHNKSFSSYHEFPFLDSPSLNETFDHAAKIATLAECFSLTKFNDFQKLVIDNTLAGHDSIVVQPTGSGKSLCFQFPPVFSNKKAIVISPTISLMYDQVRNLSERRITSTFLGSAQLDKTVEDKALSADSEDCIIFVTPEWISKPEKRVKLQSLCDKGKLSLIAIDEVHLYHHWQEFRTSYKDLELLKSEFPTTPIMALTATAPPEVMNNICKLVRDPLIVKGSVNRPNIYLECEELPLKSKGHDFSFFAARVAEKIENRCTIIYTDFINSVGPIVSELSELGIESVAYYGEMDTKSRNESYTNWKTGKVSVMVATSAFGMGIDKPDIDHIIRLGVPENICSWAQELGRAGRDGRSAVATIFYSMSDIDHGGAWVREHIHNSSYCQRILKEFSNSWRYTMSDLVGKCRRQVLLELFGEDNYSSATSRESCCDVCDQSREVSLTNHVKELEVLLDAIDVVGDKGEVKLAQWIRGSSQEWTIQYNKDSYSFSNSMGH